MQKIQAAKQGRHIPHIVVGQQSQSQGRYVKKGGTAQDHILQAAQGQWQKDQGVKPHRVALIGNGKAAQGVGRGKSQQQVGGSRYYNHCAIGEQKLYLFA